MSERNNPGRCRLCLREPVILRHSHLLSEFLYKEVYDERHRTVGVDPRPEKKDRILQKGLREYLLCGDCEGGLAKWEHYAANALENFPATGDKRPGEIAWVRGIDYCMFKLFQMSLLWRCSIAEGPTFAAVDLGPHQDKLRQMLLKADPGKPWQYGCIVAALRQPGSLKNMVRFPGKLRIEGHYAYHLVVRGLLWFFVVSSHAERLSGSGSFLSEAGDLPIHVSSETAKDFFVGVAREIDKLKKELPMSNGTQQRNEHDRMR